MFGLKVLLVQLCCFNLKVGDLVLVFFRYLFFEDKFYILIGFWGQVAVMESSW